MTDDMVTGPVSRHDRSPAASSCLLPPGFKSKSLKPFQLGSKKPGHSRAERSGVIV
jgi:hypothetical protein